MQKRKPATRPSTRNPVRVAFHCTKYGRDMLIDAALVSGMPNFITTPKAHILSFYDVMIVTEGRGTVLIDGEAYAVEPGTVVFTRPGDLRALSIPKVDAACVFFTDEFVLETMRDTQFVERFAFFRANRPSAVLTLTPPVKRAMLRQFREMRNEFRKIGDDAPHLLLALLSRFLVTLNRHYIAVNGAREAGRASPLIRRFDAEIERRFASGDGVAEFARRLNISAGHLNVLCLAHLGRTAGQLIRARRVLEAKRLLMYSAQTAERISEMLGFEDPSYFSRYFKRETGYAPTEFRKARAL
ncbi:MAG: helix-turn-helix transcriptional regulator [Rhodobacteraceae bacterium]|nr:helix-turn-helix transcriptional regulator [Paracoccaceae bacterium]